MPDIVTIKVDTFDSKRKSGTPSQGLVVKTYQRLCDLSWLNEASYAWSLLSLNASLLFVDGPRTCGWST